MTHLRKMMLEELERRNYAQHPPFLLVGHTWVNLLALMVFLGVRLSRHIRVRNRSKDLVTQSVNVLRSAFISYNNWLSLADSGIARCYDATQNDFGGLAIPSKLNSCP